MRSALIVSPYATSPLDARHRRWVYQTTRLLADAGFRITFLLLACEDGWRVRHQDEDFARLRAQWDDVAVVYGDAKIGSPPRAGDRHQLDEWWDFNLEQVLRNQLARRSFEVCVVHQVWLGRAFELCSARTVKVLAAHDLFWQLGGAATAGEIVADGFRPSETVELFGIERADIIVAANEPDAADLARRVDKKIVSLPFCDLEMERPAASAPARDPLVFGIAAERDAAAAASVRALLSALARALGTGPAPFELAVAGGGSWETSLPIRAAPHAGSLAAFYRDVDCVVAPQFFARELSPAVADAAALGRPLLASPGAAAGLRLDAALQCGSAEEMAGRMIEIGQSGPPPAADALHALHDQLRGRAASGAAKLREWLDAAVAPFVVDLGTAELPADTLVVLSYLSYLRVLAGYRPVMLVLPDAEALCAPLLPPGVTVVSRDRLAAILADMRGRPIRLHLPQAAPAAATEAGNSQLVIADTRWGVTPAHGDADAALAALPLLHSDVDREPAALDFRRRWAAADGAWRINAAGPVRLVFVDQPAGGEGVIARGLPHRLVPLRDDAAFRSAALALLEASAEVEIAWLAGECGYRHRLILQICALRGLRAWATLDAAAAIGGALPRRATAEFDRACEDGLRRLAAPAAA